METLATMIMKIRMSLPPKIWQPGTHPDSMNLGVR
jgi:hypothetical protein